MPEGPLFRSAKKNLALVKNYEPGKPLEELEREYGVKRAVKLASNENSLGPSPKALVAAKKALARVHRYPDGGSFYLRRRLSKFLGVRPETLIFGNGSDEILVMAARAFAGKGDEVLIADPTFLIYEIASRAEGANVVKVPMKNFHYDLEAMRGRLGARTKLIFIANPDNPVGTYIQKGPLLRFLKAVPRRAVVVLDEAYHEFARQEKDYPRSLELLKTFDNLIVTRTFSKAYGLSGLRIGYGVARPEVIRSLNKVREPFNVNLVAQAAAAAALDDTAHLRRTLRMVKEGRAVLQKALTALGFAVVGTATNFILADAKTDARILYEKLLRKGVIVRSMHAWGMDTFIRVTIGRPEENRKLINALKEILKKEPS
ncbi:MAG: histidinol-phosphate transaminase [Candidatus Omnitrophica bacterium]|nr:histidinol-phosphate transaminase [Candidatus Omnitrophota bacterium]